MNFFIIGSGKIGIDLYIKLNKLNLTGKKVLIARNKNSKGLIFCKKKGINYYCDGINFLKKISTTETSVIFDCTSANSSKINFFKIKKKLKNFFFINLTPSSIGQYFIPYFSYKKIPKKINMITCGGQSTLPIIIEIKKKLKSIRYVEVVSSIASLSAGKATRENINEYMINTQNAITKLAKIKKNKVILNLNPSTPPVNMMNSVFFECGKINKEKIKKVNLVLSKINKTIKNYIPGYNAKLFYHQNDNFFRVTIKVVGKGDYLSTYAGNLDIITSSSAYIGKLINEKYQN